MHWRRKGQPTPVFLPGESQGRGSLVSCHLWGSCLRKGTPLASRVAQGVSGPSSSCVWNPRVFADDARGWHELPERRSSSSAPRRESASSPGRGLGPRDALKKDSRGLCRGAAGKRKGTPLGSRVAQGVSGPSSSCVWNPRVFLDDARVTPPLWRKVKRN